MERFGVLMMLVTCLSATPISEKFPTGLESRGYTEDCPVSLVYSLQK